MRFDFKKIASVFASAVMLGSTAGMALAANYPVPIIKAGAADGAIVITSGDHPGSQVDFWAAIDLQSALQGLVTAGGVTTESTVSGEAYPLFTSGSKIYINDTIKEVKEILTDTELPTILEDEDFSGNVDADITQTITLVSGGGWSYVTFDKMPTDEEDPSVGLKLSTTKGKDLYNITLTFDKATNFSHADSKGEKLTLMGQEFTVGADTDNDELYLYKSSETLELSVGGENPNPSETVTVEGKDYTVQLKAATDTSATIKITDSEGDTDTDEIDEAKSKKMLDIEVAINLADESTATDSISAEVTVGAQKVHLKNNQEVKVGTEDDAIDGTNVIFTSTSSDVDDLTKITIQIGAEDASSDAIIPGSVFVDPVFGTFKVDFVGLNIEEDSTARETIEIKSTQDTATLKMTTHTGDEKTITWYYNESRTHSPSLADSDGDYIHVVEGEAINESEYVVVGNEDEGYLMLVKNIYNDTTGYSDDEVTLEDVFSGKQYEATITAEGSGTITIGGKEYNVYYEADKANKEDSAFFINLNYPDSTSGTNTKDKVIYPTIETSKGAKIAFYENVTINLSTFYQAPSYSGKGGFENQNVTKLRFPDGNGYEDITVGIHGNHSFWNFTVGSTTTVLNLSETNQSLVIQIADSTAESFSLNLTGSGAYDMLGIYLLDNTGKAHITKPAILVFEEEDDNNDRLGFFVEMEGKGESSDEVGVNDVEFAYQNKTLSDFKQLESDDDLYKWIDLWGTYVTIDKSESSQYTATISYPDEQVYAQIYVAEVSASITGGTTSGGGGQILVVKDSEISSVSGRNLVVVGGSCINSVAAKVLDVSYPTCGADFTTATNVGVGQYLVKAVQSPYNAEKTAILVAGYDAADTKNAVSKLKENHVTDVGTSNVYPLTAA